MYLYYFSVAAVTNYYKFSGLKPTQIYYLTVLQIKNPKRSPRAKLKVSYIPFWTLGENPFPWHSQLLTILQLISLSFIFKTSNVGFFHPFSLITSFCACLYLFLSLSLSLCLSLLFSLCVFIFLCLSLTTVRKDSLLLRTHVITLGPPE